MCHGFPEPPRLSFYLRGGSMGADGAVVLCGRFSVAWALWSSACAPEAAWCRPQGLLF